ncbi:hypothetical protein PO148_06250 [Limosilactobacillus mucosae]|uniref:Endonuclease/exonuclease/phosphatase domain-containing protein n=1 Tax=Limosilactobacillus mucosae TaxID=97478 RepID=A0AAJ1MAD5_LIMMU|nr:hypothetical protein [Limosilactobacillus mucosae]MDC2829901.1 hypothetical protein [Limosilactobacillus mucosae]MDC2837357.1 hypothetical protein [Limosilactobacillus mucosae]MDC2849579.1 hypothetical protein [Limosilactobacillus mucosae]MDC2853625.1 hypothetical protein [Limosilactobacillus mucosae]
MQTNLIKLNTYKLERGGLLVDMYDQFNARVGDQGTPLVIQWTQGTTDTPVDLQKNKLHFYAAGQVGKYLEKLDDGTGYKMSADASSVEYDDKDSAGTQANGLTVAKLPKQFFPQEGIFYGYFGLKDDQGNTYTSVNVWFRVLGGVPIMGAAIPYFSTRFDELMEQCQGRIEDALAQLQAEYQAEVKKNEDMSAETRAALSKLADSAGAIQAQIDAGNVVTRADWQETDAKATAAKNQSDENKNRLDTLTTTPSGDGATEIADARVAPSDDLFNGKVSKTAGDSIRYQTQRLEDELNSISEANNMQNILPLKKKDWISGQLLTDSGSVQTVPTDTSTTSYWLVSPFVKLDPSRYYHLTFVKPYRAYFCIYNDKQQLIYSSGGYKNEPYTFIADKNAAYIRVAVNNNGIKMVQDDLPSVQVRLYDEGPFTNNQYFYGTLNNGEYQNSSVRIVSDYIKLDYNAIYNIQSTDQVYIECYDSDKGHLPNNTVNYFTGKKEIYTGYAVRYIRLLVKRLDSKGQDISMFDFSTVSVSLSKTANSYIGRGTISPTWQIGAFNADGSEKLDPARMRSNYIRVTSDTGYKITKPNDGYLVAIMCYDLDHNYLLTYGYTSQENVIEGFDGFIRLYLQKTNGTEFNGDSDGYGSNIQVIEMNSSYTSIERAGLPLTIATNNVGSFGLGVQRGFSSTQHNGITLDQLAQNWLKYTEGIDILGLEEFNSYLDSDHTYSMREKLLKNFAVLKTGLSEEALALKKGRMLSYTVGNLNDKDGWDTEGVRGYIRAVVELNNGQQLSLYVVHFTAGDTAKQARDAQVAKLLNLLKEEKSFIVFGDFNTPASDSMWESFKSYRVVNGTYFGEFPTYIYGDEKSQSIDNIITSQNIIIKDAYVKQIKDDDWVSTDHRMLAADIIVGESY